MRNLIFKRKFNPLHFHLIAMSATFDPIDLESLAPVQIIFHPQCTGWTTTKVTEIKSLKRVIPHIVSLKAQSKPYRTLVYAPRISNMKIYEDLFTSAGLSTVCIWSPNNKQYKMNAHQLYCRDTIIQTHVVPDSIEVLIINASTETSVNLINPDFDVFISMKHMSASTIQARGRIRKDISWAYVYTPLSKNSMDSLAAVQSSVPLKPVIPTGLANNAKQILPLEYLDRDISKSEMEQLILLVGLKGSSGKLLKYPSLKAHYEQLGYSCTSVRKQVNGAKDTYYRFSLPK
jgi:hypothetical protein